MTTKPSPKMLEAILKVNGYNPFETRHLNITDVIPKELEWIWDFFSDGCPFSFGDNNYTLVDALTIRNWIVEIYDLNAEDQRKTSAKQKKALKKFVELMNLCFDAQVYINVE